MEPVTTRHELTDIPIMDAASAPTRARQILADGDTVFSTVRPYLEKIAHVGAQLDNEFASTGFCVLRPGPLLDHRWLFHFFTSRGLLDQVLPHQRGVSYPAVRDKDVLGAHTPLPPVGEQRRIVEILEGHLSRLDAAGQGLKAAERRLNALRSSSAEWAIRTAMSMGNPWSLAGLAYDAGYGTSTKCVVGGPGPAVVRIPNLLEGRVDLTDEKRVEDPLVDVSSTMLNPDDLLIVRTNGSRQLIGRTAVVQPGIDAAFASYLIRYRLDTTRVRVEWVHLMMQAPSARAVLESIAASSAGQYNLGLMKLNKVQLPVPDLAEQDRLLSDCRDVVEAAVRAVVEVRGASAHGLSLRRALLAAAFSGRLT